MRQIVFDTETTGREFKDGHRVLEIGCVEIIERRITGRTWHSYINPQRDSEEGALRVHGLSSDFLADKPLFKDIVDEFLQFISGADLIAHNADFDVGFLNNELALVSKTLGKLEDYGQVIDTLKLARSKHPGAKASLDALCRRYQVDNSKRDLHGALIDADLLAQVYLLMTGGQKGLALGGESALGRQQAEAVRMAAQWDLPVIYANEQELQQHSAYLATLAKKSSKDISW